MRTGPWLTGARAPRAHSPTRSVHEAILAVSLDATLPVNQAQVVTYLRLTGCPAGLLINFNVPRLMDGVKRLLNTEPARGKQVG